MNDRQSSLLDTSLRFVGGAAVGGSDVSLSSLSSSVLHEYGTQAYTPPTTRLCVAMVGLPARGKTYTGRKMARYLNWLGNPSRTFNVGNYRRKVAGANQPHLFFDPSNQESVRVRQEIADLALDDMVDWFTDLEHKEEREREQFRQDSIRESLSAAAAAAVSVGGASPIPARRLSSFSLSGASGVPSVGVGASSLSSASQQQQQQKIVGSPSLGPKIAVKKSQVGAARVAIYDATNSTKERRQIIMDRCEKENIQVMFVESICDRMDVILANIKEVKLSSPDYENVPAEQAVKDFMSRIYHYSKTYETLSRTENNSTISFVKLINVGERVLVNNVRGYIQSRIVYFLMNLNITPRCVYFSRHGESMYNVAGKIGGDADLSPRGWQYATRLPELIARQMDDVATSAREAASAADEMNTAWRGWLSGEDGGVAGSDGKAVAAGEGAKRIPEEEGGAAIFPAFDISDGGSVVNAQRRQRGDGGEDVKPTLTVWTSTLKRTIQTASHLAYPQWQWKALDELDSGVCDGLTYEEIEERHPEDFAARDDDKYNYRYKGGESYADLVRRLDPVMLELERHHESNHPILIIGHQAVLRALYAYFMGYSHEELPYVKIPLHTVIKLTFKAYGCIEERFKVDIEAVDTHRPRLHNALLPQSVMEEPGIEDEEKKEKKV
ncbi:Fructose-2,6-bisphosphatase [Physocladia obscura]|uniref:Fructose-2,6-bisphosphatase n=1 Tax=Physocladia obscura TaxID=109957 RepID=A0AAD5T248_9FUNG|nr:Fructose-2,6-bisphosphatase [Physocladia obscura]